MPAASIHSGSSDTASAVKNAFTLGLSLILTWSVALLVRLYLPRHLGPELFGTFTFADGFAATFIILVDLGIDIYIRKEIPVRPEHASDFFGGLAAVRGILMLALLGVMVIFLELTGRPRAVQILVLVFGAAHFMTSLNASFAALLHSVGTVDGLAVMNVASKLLWGAGIVLAITTNLGLPALAGAFLLSEMARGIALIVLTRKHIHLRFTWNVPAMKAVILASLPYYLNAVALVIHGKLDVSMLSLLISDVETGWYGSAANFTALALLLAPLIGWVLLPLLSKASSRSEEEFFTLVRRSLFGIVMLATPISLFMSLGADVWIGVLFGDAFAPAVPALRILAPMFVVTYVAMIMSTCLIMLERPWTMTAISAGSALVLPALNLLIIPRAGRWLGPGGAGTGAAIALMLCEIGVAVALAVAVGRRAFKPFNFITLAKVVGACLAVVGLDVALRPLGPVRIAAGVVVYAGLLVGLRVVRLEHVRQLLKLLRERRGDAKAAAPPSPASGR